MNTASLPPARYAAALVCKRLLILIDEILVSHSSGEPKDDDKYGMIADLVVKFGTISDIALQQEENSKEGIEFLNKMSSIIDDALKAIDPLMDEFYTSHIISFEEFRNTVLSIVNKIENALCENDIKQFLLDDHEVEEGRRDLDYVPYTECGWSDNEMEMCNDLLENLDLFYTKLVQKCGRLLGEKFSVH